MWPSERNPADAVRDELAGISLRPEDEENVLRHIFLSQIGPAEYLAGTLPDSTPSPNIEDVAWEPIGTVHKALNEQLIAATFAAEQNRKIVSVAAASNVGKTKAILTMARDPSVEAIPLLIRVAHETSSDIAASRSGSRLHVSLMPPFQRLVDEINSLPLPDTPLRAADFRASADRGMVLILVLLCSYCRWMELTLEFANRVVASDQGRPASLESLPASPFKQRLQAIPRDSVPLVYREMLARCTWNGACNGFVERAFARMAACVRRLDGSFSVEMAMTVFAERMQALHTVLNHTKADDVARRSFMTLVLDEFAALTLGHTPVFARVSGTGSGDEPAKSDPSVAGTLLVGVSRVLEMIRKGGRIGVVLLGSHFSTGPSLMTLVTSLRPRGLAFFTAFPLMRMSDIVDSINKLAPAGQNRLREDDEEVAQTLLPYSGRPGLFFSETFPALVRSLVGRRWTDPHQFGAFVLDSARSRKNGLMAIARAVVNRVLDEDVSTAPLDVHDLLWSAISGVPVIFDDKPTTREEAAGELLSSWAVRLGLVPFPIEQPERGWAGVAFEEPAILQAAEDRLLGCRQELWRGYDVAVRGALGPLGTQASESDQGTLFEEFVVLIIASGVRAGGPCTLDTALGQILGNEDSLLEFTLPPSSLAEKGGSGHDAPGAATGGGRRTPGTDTGVEATSVEDRVAEPREATDQRDALASSESASEGGTASSAASAASSSSFSRLSTTTRDVKPGFDLRNCVCRASRVLNVRKMQTSKDHLQRTHQARACAAARDLPWLFWDVERRHPRLDTVFYNWSGRQSGPDVLFWVEDTGSIGAELFTTAPESRALESSTDDPIRHADGGAGGRARAAEAHCARSLLDEDAYRRHRDLFESGVRRWRLVAVQLKHREKMDVAKAVGSLELPMLWSETKDKLSRRRPSATAWANFRRTSRDLGLDRAFETPIRVVLRHGEDTGNDDLAHWQRATCEDGRSPLFFLTVTNDALAEHGVGSYFTAKGGDIVNVPAAPLRASSVVEFRELD